MSRIIALIAVAVAAGYALHAMAQSRFETRSSAAPIGTSSSNGISFAWFYDAADRMVYVCRAGATGEAIDCKARAQLH